MEIIYPGKPGALFNIACGYTLILITIWSTRALQRELFWIDVAFFLTVAVLALYHSPMMSNITAGNTTTSNANSILVQQSLEARSLTAETASQMSRSSGCQESHGSNAFVRFFRQRFRMPHIDLPPLQFSIVVISLGIIAAAAVLLVSAHLGTLHRLFGRPNAILHGGTYLMWAVVQQWIQQSFFFARMERVIERGVLASFTTAALFGLAHLPNPVLAPLTFLGGWLLSELYRRYRSVVPLGIAHGLVGLAVALAVPDSLNHHMRVGLGYLRYMG